ncbi:hypothetical protein SRHO_G00174620 [Serrasalmus rhombeus]
MGSKTVEEIKREHPRLLDTPGMAAYAKLLRTLPFYTQPVLGNLDNWQKSGCLFSETEIYGLLARRSKLLEFFQDWILCVQMRKTFRPSCEETKSFVDLQPTEKPELATEIPERYRVTSLVDNSEQRRSTTAL